MAARRKTVRKATATKAKAVPATYRGLAPDTYVSDAFFARECRTLFRRAWLCVGHAEDVPRPGDYASFDLLGEPFVLVRGLDNVVRVLSRVCQHRSMLVVEGAGNARSFACPYHMWTYGLDGQLAGAPEMQKTPGFDPARCALPGPRAELWNNLVFVNFDPKAKPLAPRWAGLDRFFKNFRLAELKPARSFEFLVEWNWKVMCENFIEIYHHLGAHRLSLEPVLPARLGRTEPEEGPFTILHSPPKSGVEATGWMEGDEGVKLPAIAGLSAEEERLTTFAHGFPAHLMSFFRDRMEYYLVFPEGARRTRIRKVICVPSETMAHPDFAAGIETVARQFLSFRQEDVFVNDRVMRGVGSRYAPRATFSHLEETLWRFAAYVRAETGVR
ncbi:MAG: aromatic ring-hydroxylating dioxygenase subunit alpha [Alphaproteobacteria bacterium]|nr:aromatic ring-hydroxylating dioxygenase subunit alpha [Alphaproteobacteria bacterium]